MDDQRDYAEEAANRAAMEQEGAEEYEAWQMVAYSDKYTGGEDWYNPGESA